jgi:WD40 repeat protein
MVRLWDAATGKPLARFGPYGVPAFDLAFLPDGKSLATAHADGRIRVWEPKRGKLLRVVGKHKGALLAVAVSPDGLTFAWAGQHSGLGLWDAATGKPRHSLPGSIHHVHATIAFAPDGDLVAAAGDYAGLWDPLTGKRLGELPGVRLPSHLAFSPDGLLLAGAHRGGVVLWDVLTRKVVRTFTGHLGEVQAVAFSPDNRLLLSAGADGTLLAWDLTGRLKGGRLPALVLGPKELEKRWEALAAADGARAHEVAWELAACPRAVAFLKKKLLPVAPLPPGRLKRLIAALDDDSFDAREKAVRDLSALGEVAVPALRRAMKEGLSLEAHRRAERVLRALEASPGERLRGRRALAVLERAGARALLEALARGEPEAPRTRQAKAALARLARR